MRQKVELALQITLGLVALITGYILVMGVPLGLRTAIAYPATMPSNPHIAYLRPEGSSQDNVSEAAVASQGITLMRSWAALREAEKDRPLDAVIIDHRFFAAMSGADQTWLQAQLKKGVVIVNVGADDGTFANSLRLDTLTASDQPPKQMREIDYLIIYASIHGSPDDVKLLEENQYLGSHKTKTRSLKSKSSGWIRAV